LRISQADLTADMQTFLLLTDQDNPDLGTPHCPLCNDERADYRGLTDREVDLAWYDAANAYSRVWGSGENPHQPGWQGIWCVPSWREKRRENLGD